MIDMGTKKGQVRKTARRAYTPKRPKTKITKEGGLLFFMEDGRVSSLRKGMVRDWSNIGGSFTWPRPLRIRKK